MALRCIFVMAFAILGTSAKPMLNSGFQSNGFNILNGNCGSSLPVINTHIKTGVVENPTVQFPTCVPPTSVSENCHCFKTVVRQQPRNEIITVPIMDRIVRTVTSPVVETINCHGQTQTSQTLLPTGDKTIRIIQLDNNNMRNNNMFGGNNNQGIFSQMQGSNSANIFSNLQGMNQGFNGNNGNNGEMMNRQIIQLGSTGGFPGSSTIFSNNGNMNGF